jgi:hypothetical protein
VREKLGVLANTCHPSDGEKHIIGGLRSRLSKITKAKKKGKDVEEKWTLAIENINWYSHVGKQPRS